MATNLLIALETKPTTDNFFWMCVYTILNPFVLKCSYILYALWYDSSSVAFTIACNAT